MQCLPKRRLNATRHSVWMCMIKIFGGGRVVTPSKPQNNFCLYPPPVLRCFWKDPLMTPTTPLQASFTATPGVGPPHPPPFPPPTNFDHTSFGSSSTFSFTFSSTFNFCSRLLDYLLLLHLFHRSTHTSPQISQKDF